MREEGDRGAGEYSQHLAKRLAERERIAVLRHRCQLLSQKDAIFIQMVLERGSSFSQIAKLTGQNEATIRRRFHKLTGRLISRHSLALFRNYNLDDVTQSIARAYYIEGLSLQDIADKTGKKLYSVRKKVMQLRGMARGKHKSFDGFQRRSEQCISSM